jgi:translation initiation factor eIF-2B subunit epsilon
MAKKKTKGSSSGGGAADDTTTADLKKRHEQPLQAVLLAEDWSCWCGSTVTTAATTTASSKIYAAAERYAWAPLATAERPSILSPFLNRPLIEYTIQYLAQQGVQELYVLCATAAVEEYIISTAPQQQQQPRSDRGAYHHHHTMKLIPIRDATLTNAGDALRELEKRNVIASNPFLLLHGGRGGGGMITNIALAEPIRIHAAAVAAAATAHTAASKETMAPPPILTMILQRVGPTSRERYAPLRSTLDDLVLGLDASTTTPSSSTRRNTNHATKRILLYDDRSTSRTTQIPCSFFNMTHTAAAVELRIDLVDLQSGRADAFRG